MPTAIQIADTLALPAADELRAQILGKPMNYDTACQQLRAASGRIVVFHTAVCLLNAASKKLQTRVVPTRVHFRVLDEATIKRYLEKEQPYNCAGSAKAEALGITLLQRFEAEDPTAVIGLPLIALSEMLRQEGVTVP